MLESNFRAKYIFNADVNALDVCTENYPLSVSY